MSAILERDARLILKKNDSNILEVVIPQTAEAAQGGSALLARRGVLQAGQSGQIPPTTPATRWLGSRIEIARTSGTRSKWRIRHIQGALLAGLRGSSCLHGAALYNDQPGG
ncbi:hypothetical protein [Aquamicrobium ahrensii]|uniref:Uncharacterized protein n=1 Tax=Aquamicrobium ahrensii TaxID=469551 RepID=A0ABV2KGV6_9HYPH